MPKNTSCVESTLTYLQKSKFCTATSSWQRIFGWVREAVFAFRLAEADVHVSLHTDDQAMLTRNTKPRAATCFKWAPACQAACLRKRASRSAQLNVNSRFVTRSVCDLLHAHFPPRFRFSVKVITTATPCLASTVRKRLLLPFFQAGR